MKNIKYILIAIFFLFSLTLTQVAAEEATTSSSPNVTKRTHNQETLKAKQELLEQRKAQIEEQIQLRKKEMEETKERIKERKEEIKQNMEDIREEFKVKLEELKDERKQKIIEHLSEMYGRINDRWTDHFLRILDRLTKILDKIELRAAEVTTTEITDSIADARTAIADAKTAVEEQAVKEYIIDLSDEEKLGEAAQDVHEQLRADLKATREKVQDAREAVHTAFKALRDALASQQQTETEETGEE
ncbi:MAG TPA: hypothetical protein VJB91_01625 [Patescibacteria group bacterium]|nr:hypothetical protein [Patescibacteria group bacterium]